MVSSVQNVENICNIALGKIGYPRRLGDMFEGSRQSKFCLDIYAQTRDELLRANDWGFAERNVIPTLLKQAPLNGYSPFVPWTPEFPPPPWFFEYTYPSDCIKIRAIKSSQIFIPNFAPVPNVFDVINDNSFTPAVKTFVCNVPNAILVYTGQVTDMTTWEPLFVQTLVDALADKLAPGLAKIDQSGDAGKKEEMQDEAMDETIAARMQG
jgi:hypothetical protein